MIGRLLGIIAGIAIALFGYGLLKPAAFARYVDFAHFEMGPFGMYKTLIAGLIMATGAAVAIAAAQRSASRKRTRPAVSLFSAPEEPSASTHGPHDAPAASHADSHHEELAHRHDDDHGHGHEDADHGHDDHGHEPAHAHEPAHGHH